MFIDSLLLYGLVKELQQMLQAAVVRQIHQVDARVIDIELYRLSSPPVHLLVSAQNPPYLYAAVQNKKQSQYIASQNFIMTLRKNLEGSRLSAAEQVQMDRIIRFSFDRIESEGRIVTKHLYAELIPSAPNLILTEEGRILDVLVRSRKQHRDLSIQREYTLPEGAGRLDFMQFTEKELTDLLLYGQQEAASLRDFLFARFNGLSTVLLSRLASTSGLSMEQPLDRYSAEDLQKAAAALVQTAGEIRAAQGLYVWQQGKKSMASLLPDPALPMVHLPSISQWIARSAEEAGSGISVSIQELRRQIHSLLKKEQRKQEKIQSEMEETSQMDRYKLWGNLLAIYAYQKIHGEKSITVDNPFEETGGKETIPLEPEYDLIQNSQLYFKKYNRMKTRRSIGQEKLEECRVRVEYLQNAAYFVEELKDRQSLETIRAELRESGLEKRLPQRGGRHQKQRRECRADEPAVYTFGGYTLWVGKNSRQNEYLTLHKADKNDIWLHARKIPGSHVVIQTGGVPVPEPVLEKAASLAAWYSKGKESGKVDVDYTQIRYVKKIRNAPPGLVSYTHQKTLVSVPSDPNQK